VEEIIRIGEFRSPKISIRRGIKSLELQASRGTPTEPPTHATKSNLTTTPNHQKTTTLTTTKTLLQHHPNNHHLNPSHNTITLHHCCENKSHLQKARREARDRNPNG
jgi:hypothetical protein